MSPMRPGDFDDLGSTVTHSSLARSGTELSDVARTVVEEAALLQADLAALGDRWGGGEVGATIGRLDGVVLRLLLDRCTDLAELLQADSGKVMARSAIHREAERETVTVVERGAPDV